MSNIYWLILEGSSRIQVRKNNTNMFSTSNQRRKSQHIYVIFYAIYIYIYRIYDIFLSVYGQVSECHLTFVGG